jgi:hypothetical protein
MLQRYLQVCGVVVHVVVDGRDTAEDLATLKRLRVAVELTEEIGPTTVLEVFEQFGSRAVQGEHDMEIGDAFEVLIEWDRDLGERRRRG